jgi:membrane-bound lytic murein transglycosylase F
MGTRGVLRIARLGLVVVCASLHAPLLAQSAKPPSEPALPAPPPPVIRLGASLVTARYDVHFQKYAKRFFGPGFDWRLFKAQGMAESNLNPNARSWVGARGLMQIMPRTLEEIRGRNPELRVVKHDEFNIAAGIAYDRQLWDLWEDNLDAAHLREFMLGSYNAGRGTLLRAQDVAESAALDERVWPSIKLVAPKVPRWRSEETLTYVDRIFLNLGRMDRNGQVPIIR